MERNKKGQFIKGTNGDTFKGFGIWYDKKGYATIWSGGKSVKLHVYIWERANGEKPKGYDIHHKDMNKGNYNLSNLELLSKSDHLKIHAGWVSKDGEWVAKPCKECKKKLPLDKFYQRKGYTPSNLCIECSKLVSIRVARKSGVLPKRYIIPNSKGEYQCKDCGEWKTPLFFKLKVDKKPQSYCKDCFNIRQNICRKKRNSPS